METPGDDKPVKDCKSSFQSDGKGAQSDNRIETLLSTSWFSMSAQKKLTEDLIERVITLLTGDLSSVSLPSALARAVVGVLESGGCRRRTLHLLDTQQTTDICCRRLPGRSFVLSWRHRHSLPRHTPAGVRGLCCFLGCAVARMEGERLIRPIVRSVWRHCHKSNGHLSV